MSFKKYFFYFLCSCPVSAYYQGFLSQGMDQEVVEQETKPSSDTLEKKGHCAGFVHFWIKDQLYQGNRFEQFSKLLDPILNPYWDTEHYNPGTKVLNLLPDFEQLLKTMSSYQQQELKHSLKEVDELQKKFGVQKHVSTQPQRVGKKQIAKKISPLFKGQRACDKSYWSVTVGNVSTKEGHMVGISLDSLGKGTFYDPNYGIEEFSEKSQISERVQALADKLLPILKKSEKDQFVVSIKRITKKDFSGPRRRKKSYKWFFVS
jgi:hypothetical protein